MRRKQRKSLPWRRFGYVILIIIKFGELLLWFSPRIINALRSYIKHSKECFIRYPNTSKSVKKTRLRLVFSTHFLVFGYLMKHSSSCLIYYVFNITGPSQPVCFAGLYRNCSSQSPGYFCERVRVRCVKKSLHHKSSICICVFFLLLWSVSGRMSRSPPKRGRPPTNEKHKTILLRESTLKPKDMLLLFINECQSSFWNQVFIEAIVTWPGKNTLQT